MIILDGSSGGGGGNDGNNDVNQETVYQAPGPSSVASVGSLADDYAVGGDMNIMNESLSILGNTTNGQTLSSLSTSPPFSFTGGGSTTTNLPSDVRKVGYIKKLKSSPSMVSVITVSSRKYFVLRMNHSIAFNKATLSYYDSEKKFLISAQQPRKVILLANCFDISRKFDKHHRYVLCLYTNQEMLGMVFDTELLLVEWMEAMKMIVAKCPEFQRRRLRDFHAVWQVHIKSHGLAPASARIINGFTQRLCLTPNTLFLIRADSTVDEPENHYCEFPLSSIRRCGHTNGTFFLELGRSSPIGSGELWINADDEMMAQHMHEMVLLAMTHSLEDTSTDNHKDTVNRKNSTSSALSLSTNHATNLLFHGPSQNRPRSSSASTEFSSIVSSTKTTSASTIPTNPAYSRNRIIIGGVGHHQTDLKKSHFSSNNTAAIEQSSVNNSRHYFAPFHNCLSNLNHQQSISSQSPLNSRERLHSGSWSRTASECSNDEYSMSACSSSNASSSAATPIMAPHSTHYHHHQHDHLTNNLEVHDQHQPSTTNTIDHQCVQCCLLTCGCGIDSIPAINTVSLTKPSNSSSSSLCSTDCDNISLDHCDLCHSKFHSYLLSDPTVFNCQQQATTEPPDDCKISNKLIPQTLKSTLSKNYGQHHPSEPSTCHYHGHQGCQQRQSFIACQCKSCLKHSLMKESLSVGTTTLPTIPAGDPSDYLPMNPMSKISIVENSIETNDEIESEVINSDVSSLVNSTEERKDDAYLNMAPMSKTSNENNIHTPTSTNSIELHLEKVKSYYSSEDEGIAKSRSSVVSSNLICPQNQHHSLHHHHHHQFAHQSPPQQAQLCPYHLHQLTSLRHHYLHHQHHPGTQLNPSYGQPMVIRDIETSINSNKSDSQQESSIFDGLTRAYSTGSKPQPLAPSIGAQCTNSVAAGDSATTSQQQQVDTPLVSDANSANSSSANSKSTYTRIRALSTGSHGLNLNAFRLRKNKKQANNNKFTEESKTQMSPNGSSLLTQTIISQTTSSCSHANRNNKASSAPVLSLMSMQQRVRSLTLGAKPSNSVQPMPSEMSAAANQIHCSVPHLATPGPCHFLQCSQPHSCSIACQTCQVCRLTSNLTMTSSQTTTASGPVTSSLSTLSQSVASIQEEGDLMEIDYSHNQKNRSRQSLGKINSQVILSEFEEQMLRESKKKDQDKSYTEPVSQPKMTTNFSTPRLSSISIAPLSSTQETRKRSDSNSGLMNFFGLSKQNQPSLQTTTTKPMTPQSQQQTNDQSSENFISDFLNLSVQHASMKNQPKTDLKSIKNFPSTCDPKNFDLASPRETGSIKKNIDDDDQENYVLCSAPATNDRRSLKQSEHRSQNRPKTTSLILKDNGNDNDDEAEAYVMMAPDSVTKKAEKSSTSNKRKSKTLSVRSLLSSMTSSSSSSTPSGNGTKLSFKSLNRSNSHVSEESFKSSEITSSNNKTRKSPKTSKTNSKQKRNFSSSPNQHNGQNFDLMT